MLVKGAALGEADAEVRSSRSFARAKGTAVSSLAFGAVCLNTLATCRVASTSMPMAAAAVQMRPCLMEASGQHESLSQERCRYGGCCRGRYLAVSCCRLLAACTPLQACTSHVSYSVSRTWMGWDPTTGKVPPSRASFAVSCCRLEESSVASSCDCLSNSDVIWRRSGRFKASPRRRCCRRRRRRDRRSR